jgi:hypothetical protein
MRKASNIREKLVLDLINFVPIEWKVEQVRKILHPADADHILQKSVPRAA